MKEYAKPEVTKVKLTTEESVLVACKTAPGATPGCTTGVQVPLYSFGS